jgi:hypothetical protein
MKGSFIKGIKTTLNPKNIIESEQNIFSELGIKSSKSIKAEFISAKKLLIS